METATITRTQWALDKTHSEIQFKAKHLMITTVTGVFQDFQLSVETEGEDFTKSSISFSAEIASISTGNADRDNHLKSDDFFNAEKYPQLRFEGKSLQHKSGDQYLLTGDLTIRDVTKSVSLEVEFGGIAKDPWGNTKAGFSLQGKVNRKDFNLKWNIITDAGSVLVSEEVKIHCEVQLVKS